MPYKCPGISVDQHGVCNYCREHKDTVPYGEDALLKKIRSRQGGYYDCLTGLSGGKDSSYVAYYLKKRLKLRVLAVFYDSPFYCDLARRNIKNVCDGLGIELITVETENNLEYKFVRNHLMSVLPSGRTWGQCNFCHFGIEAILYNEAKKRNIPFIVSGFTRHERTIALNRKKVFLSMFRKLYKRYLLFSAYHQVKAFLLLIRQRTQLRPHCSGIYNVYEKIRLPIAGPEKIDFFDYVGWDYKEMERILSNRVGWILPDEMLSWSYDCVLEPLLNYSYLKEIGISTTGMYLSNMIRIGQIERDEALRILDKYETGNYLRQRVEYVFDFLKIPQKIQARFF
jgi:hypothetical protein